MSAFPTIPGAPSIDGAFSAGPDGISASLNVALDMCNARPVMIYVTLPRDAGSTGSWPATTPPPAGAPAPPPPPPAPISPPPAQPAVKGGQIWRLFDVCAAVEKLPVWKEWTEEKTYPNGHWEPVYRDPPPPEQPPERPVEPPPYVCTEVIALSDAERTLFKFDRPKATDATSSYPNALENPADLAGDIARVAAALRAPAQRENGGSVPIEQTGFERKLVVFGHADLCAPFTYNFGLSHRRNLTLGIVMQGAAPSVPVSAEDAQTLRGALLNTGRSAGFIPCADFNPQDIGTPTSHELRAEQASSGFANHNPQVDDQVGNRHNRRIELFVIPDYKRSTGRPSEITRIINEIRGSLMAANGITPSQWPEGQFPCPAGSRAEITPESTFAVCGKLSTAQPGPKHANLTATGRAFRQCKFYDAFTNAVRNLRLTDCQQGPQPQPQPQPTPQPTGPVFDHWKWVDDEPVKVTEGCYLPPRGEHYSYYMRRMIEEEGVPARDVFAPAVAVAPNDQVNADDFNLIKAGSIRVVKMDIGFWGDERKKDPARQSGVKRVPARYFGLIEGQFVFQCYLQTPENAGFVRPCSEGFDKDLTPLCDKLDQAVRALGPNFKILIMGKAVAEDGPDKQRLKVLFPDMHLPRKFDDRDPVYATDECVRRVQSVKSMVIHQLKRDYRLPAAMTPWLTTLDRRMCRDFFENNAPRLKLPHIYTQGGPRLESRASDEGGLAGAASAAADAARNAYNFLMQVGYRMFTFTQDDYRRMVRVYPDSFPEKGYGRTKDSIFNWFYGFNSDKNIPAAPEGAGERTAKNLVPGLVQEVLDTHAGTSLGVSDGTRPATENYGPDQIDPAPARDLLRFLDVIQKEQAAGTNIDVIQTGDLYELWVNRRFLFEDFHETDDPVGQITDLMSGLSTPSSSGGVLGAGMDALKFLARSIVKILLGGFNATDHDLWFRRESNKPAADPNMDPDQMMLQPEEAYNLDKFDPTIHLPRFTPPAAGPGVVGGGVQGPPGGGQISADGIEYTQYRLGTPRDDGSLGPFNATNDRGKAYLVREVNRRIAQVEAFEAPIRPASDAQGNAEDRRLLGTGNLVGPNRDKGLWNRAIVQAFRRCRATFVYGNHDGYRGVPRDNGVGTALPYYSEPGLWVEHGHRFEDSNIDGQPFGAFITNLAYEITELAFGEGILDEYSMHREQSMFQPGVFAWFLLVQFGGDEFLKRYQRANENVPAVHPFRITVNSHTHVPDLVVGQYIFKDKEVAKVDLPLVGSVSVETLINTGGALLKAVLLWKKFEEWYNDWKNRSGFEKWWEDIKGNTINWGVDFAGLAGCVDRAIDFIKQQGENKARQLAQEFKDSYQSAKDTVDQNRRNLGL